MTPRHRPDGAAQSRWARVVAVAVIAAALVATIAPRSADARGGPPTGTIAQTTSVAGAAPVSTLSAPVSTLSAPVSTLSAPVSTLSAPVIAGSASAGTPSAPVGAPVAVAGAPALVAAAATRSPVGENGGGITADEARAEQLAVDLRVRARLIDQLSEQADAAAIRLAQLDIALVDARRDARASDDSLAVATRLLAAQAVAAYTGLGAGHLDPNVPGTKMPDPGLAATYGDVVAGARQSAVATYRAVRARQATRQAALAAAAADTARARDQARIDRAAAGAAAAAERAILDGLDIHMAGLVASARASDAAASAAAVRFSLVVRGQLPAGAVPTAAAVPDLAPPPPLTPGPPANAPASPGHPASPAAPATAGPATAGPATAGPATAGPTGAGPTVGSNRPAPGAAGPPASPAAPAPARPPVVTTTVPPARPSPPTSTPASPPPVSPTRAQVAISFARAQMGKPYQWGGAGPAAFDCSGLVQQAWAAAGVHFQHLAQSQYDATARVAIPALLPGDLVFFGTPSDIYHVGIYLGGGDMIDAPSAGEVVRVESMWWSDLLGGGRVVG